MASLEVVSLERPEAPGGCWVLTFKLPSSLLDASPGTSPAIDISATSVRVESVNGDVAVGSLPAGCGDIDSEQASCKLQKKKCQLVISWPAASDAEAIEKPLSPAGVGRSVPEAGYAAEVAAQRAPMPTATPTREKGGAKDSLDYSRFDRIADDMQESPSRPQKSAAEYPNLQQPAAASSTAVPKRSAVLDYSRFEEVSEEDATVPMVELEKLWRQLSQLQRMRGESPDGFTEWQRRRSKLCDSSTSGPHTDNLSGRGLWSRTNMEETFAAEATRAAEEKPTDADLPALAAPDLLSAMTTAPGAEVLDIAKWARSLLQEELVKACATDKGAGRGGVNREEADIRVDAIVYAAEIGGGSAGIVVDGQNFLCAYQFAVKVSYCVAVSERPVAGGPPPETKYMGDVNISELASGNAVPGKTYYEALTARMKTSLRDPKPPKRHLAAIRPVLGRLELSLAHFVRRFERRVLTDRSKHMAA